jgi:hypothetical protein
MDGLLMSRSQGERTPGEAHRCLRRSCQVERYLEFSDGYCRVCQLEDAYQTLDAQLVAIFGGQRTHGERLSSETMAMQRKFRWSGDATSFESSTALRQQAEAHTYSA